MKKIIKLILFLLIIFFFSVYFSNYNNNYYENKNILTEEAIKKFESDLKNGKKINMSNYIEEEKNYNNKVSKVFIKIDNFIDKCISSSFKIIIKYLDENNN